MNIRAETSPHGALAFEIAGFRVSALRFGAHIDLITRAALASEGQWVLTLNFEMVARSAVDPAYRALMAEPDLVVADGVPIVLLSRLGLTPGAIPERSCGVDLTRTLLQSFPGLFGIIGGQNPRTALEKLGVDLGRLSYLFDGEVDPNALGPHIAGLKASGCQLVFVALGVPKQDLVCRALRRACPGLVLIGVGGSFEMLGGLRPRAPALLRTLGLEWLYRLALEPRRLAGRYLILYPRALPYVLRWAWSARNADR